MGTRTDLPQRSSPSLMPARLVRARLLLLSGCFAAGVGAGLLLTGSAFLGVVAIAGALMLSGAGFSTGVQPGGTLVRRMRQAPGVGLIVVGGVRAATDFGYDALVCLVLGTAVLALDRALVRRAAGLPMGWSLPRPRSIVPARRKPLTEEKATEPPAVDDRDDADDPAGVTHTDSPPEAAKHGHDVEPSDHAGESRQDGVDLDVTLTLPVARVEEEFAEERSA